MCDVAASHHPSMLSSPERHIRRVSHEPGPELDSATPSDDDSPRSPPQLSGRNQGLAAHRPQPSPSIVGQYDFAWDESPAPRSSPRLAFNNRSLLRRYDGVEGFPKTWKNVDAASSKRKRRPVSAEDVGRTRPRVLTPEPDDPPPQTKLDFSDAMSDDDDDAETREPHRSLVELLWGLSEYDSRRAPG